MLNQYSYLQYSKDLPSLRKSYFHQRKERCGRAEEGKEGGKEGKDLHLDDGSSKKETYQNHHQYRLNNGK